MMYRELKELQDRYTSLCRMIFDSAGDFSFQQVAENDGSPHVEFDGTAFHMVTTERGLELSRQTTRDEDDILFWMVRDASFWAAVRYELENRVNAQDSRRIIFKEWRRLVAKCGGKFAERLDAEIDTILNENPYTDGGSI